MLFYRYFFLLVLGLLGTNFVECAEFVPVYMWGTLKVPEQVPALHKISQDSYKDALLEHLRNDPYIVVFAERTLSPEDFAQRNAKGNIAYPNLAELKQSTPMAYKPYVQNPIGAVKQLGKEVTEFSIDSFLNNPNVPKNNILIIDLNDAKDDEQRFQMLSRHDSTISRIYKDLLEKHENILAIYTAHHTSWVAPIELHHTKTRHILQSDEPTKGKMLQNEFGSVYFGDVPVLEITKPNSTTENAFETLEVDSSVDNIRIMKIKSSKDVSEIQFNFTLTESNYWIADVKMTYKGSEKDPSFSIAFPYRFSYHCGEAVLKIDDNTKLYLPGLQIQPLSIGNETDKFAFGDAYDCVGFTTIPIWSGLFVTFIMLMILTFGITMIMDIKTMDRFDDAKGKTITISAD